MIARIYLGVRRVRMPGDRNFDDITNGNKILDEVGRRFHCPVWPENDFHLGFPGFLPAHAVRYLSGQIQSAGGPVSIRLFGWGCGAIMLCRIAEDLKHCQAIPPERRKIDLCFAIDPLWSGASFYDYPEIPDNVLRWVCVRQNLNGDAPPTNDIEDIEYWQGVRLPVQNPYSTEYDEVNVATGTVMGNPGFVLAPVANISHAQMPTLASPFAHQILSSEFGVRFEGRVQEDELVAVS